MVDVDFAAIENKTIRVVHVEVKNISTNTMVNVDKITINKNGG